MSKKFFSVENWNLFAGTRWDEKYNPDGKHQPGPPEVFISYSQEDKEAANVICASLESHNISCWIAPRDIQSGEDYAEAIIHAIVRSKIMVVVYSSHANASPLIAREVEQAVHNNLTLIPFRIDNSQPSDVLRYYISEPQWLDASEPPLEKHLDLLATAINNSLPKKPENFVQKIVASPSSPPPLTESVKQKDRVPVSPPALQQVDENLKADTPIPPRQVFLSYASEDQEMADKLQNALEDEGLQVWIDQKDILLGNWKERVIDGLNHSRAVVFLLTEHSLASDSVRKEISFATDNGVAIIPVQFAHFKHEDFPNWYAFDYKDLHRHQIDPDHYSEGVKRLVEAIRSVEKEKDSMR
jgi:hypothetical protein